MDFFDTSALLPYYRPEPLSATVQNLLHASGNKVAISSLVEVEIASALARLVRMGEFNDNNAASVHNAFAADINRGCFKYLAVDTVSFRQAQQFLLERKSSLRTLDALHLACAALAGARLITADRALAAAAEVHGVNVLLLRQSPGQC